MESAVVSYARLALDATVLRHQVIAHNIANASTPGYQPLQVDFESQLAWARRAWREGDPTEIAQAALASARPAVVPDPAGAAGVMLDVETMRLSQNSLHHQALLKALDKRGALYALAVGDGRR